MTAEPTFYCIPHSHWEGAVFITREEYLEVGLPHILQALQLLAQYPEYRYTIDQACYVQPFLARYPEQAAAFRRYVEEGRLAIVGGTDVMLDVNMPGGESFVRQVLYGKGYFRRELGVDVTSGWQLDNFGHHAQMPQLLRLAGLDAFWFFRGVSGWDIPSEFLWEGLDGTRIPAIWLQQGYTLLYGAPRTLPEFTAWVRERYAGLAPQSRSADRVGVTAHDVCAPEAHLPEMLARFNAQPDRPFRLQCAVPADYEAALAARGDLPVIDGELNPIFQGTYSSRIELKQRTRALETQLMDAEALGALLHARGVATDTADLWQAWEPMLFNQAHDLMSGVMTDTVYEDTLRGYDFSARIAGEAVQARLRALVDRIDTRGDGISLVVVNTLGWARSDIAYAYVGFGEPGMRGVALTGPDGQSVPVQIVAAERHPDGALITATIAFVAKVPALGFAVYHLHLLTEGMPPAAVGGDLLENDVYRVEVDLATGAISRLTVKDGSWEALSGLANVVAMEPDHGDLWELYQPLDGGSRIAMTERHPAPVDALFSTAQTTEPGVVTCGPVVSEFTVTHPFSDAGRFSTTIRLYASLPRIDIRTTILNNDKCVRYRALFPTTIAQGRNVQEIPFGAIERPEGIEFPAQNWVDWSDGARGVALLNRGLPGNNVTDGTLLLSLLRSTSIVAYGYQGGYGPGMGSDSGLELGRTLTFDYALMPHAGDWTQAAPWRDGQAFNHPLIAVTAETHPGPMSPRHGLLDIDATNIVLSSAKVSEDGARIVLRLYEAAGEATTARLTVPGCVAAEVINLLEDPLQSLDHADLTLEFRSFEIKTLALTLEGSPS